MIGAVIRPDYVKLFSIPARRKGTKNRFLPLPALNRASDTPIKE